MILLKKIFNRMQNWNSIVLNKIAFCSSPIAARRYTSMSLKYTLEVALIGKTQSVGNIGYFMA